MCWRSFIATVTLLIVFSSAVLAELPAEIAQDLAPLSAVVLLERGDEVLIDLTSEKGGQVGDLLAVISKGMVLNHPQTGEQLGRLDELTGLLQIVQLRPGYAIAKRLEGGPLQAGTEVHRFDQIAAQFIDTSSLGEGLFVALRTALPRLQWREYCRIPPAEVVELGEKETSFHGLFFIYNGQVLEVRDQKQALLYRYADVASKEAVLNLPAAVLPPSEAVRQPPNLAGEVVLKAKWLGAGAKGLPIGVAVADFDADGKLEIARAFEEHLEIGRIENGEFERLFSFSLASETTAIALTVVDLNRNGRVEIFLTTVKQDEVRAEVFEYNQGQFLSIAQSQPWFLNSIELPEKGLILLGQKRDRSHYGFSPEIYELEWKDQQLRPKAVVPLPEKGMIYSLAALPAAGRDRFVRINSDGRVEIFSNKDGALWVSDERGDSETGFLQTENQNPHWDAEFLHKVFLPAALIAGPDGSVITALNTGRTASDKYRQMSSLNLTAWQWQNQELKPLWQMAAMDGYVPAMTVADADNDGQDELVLLLAHPNNSIFGARKSVIKLFELR